MGRRNTRVEVCLQGSQLAALIGHWECPWNYLVTFLAWFLTFAHRFFAALIIAALPAADKMHFWHPVNFALRRAAHCFCSRSYSIQLVLATCLTAFQVFSLRA